MATPVDRPLTAEEVAVVRTALERAPVSPELAPLAGRLDRLRVVDRCKCGCASVDFAVHDPSNPERPIADGLARTAAGGTVGVLVWGRPDAVTGLEIYDMGAGQDDLGLPVPSSILSWEDFGRSPSMR